MSAPVGIVVVDDHPLLRDGVARSLDDSGTVHRGRPGRLGGRCRSPGRRAPARSRPARPQHAGRRARGGAADRREAPEVRIVVLTVSEADDDIMAALKAGAKGYVLKGVGSAMLVDILQGVAKGESYVSPSLAARLLTEMRTREPGGTSADPLSTVDATEEEILRLVAHGLSNKEVGLRLDLQEKTVKHHMTRILGKLHVRNRTEAAVLLREAASAAVEQPDFRRLKDALSAKCTHSSKILVGCSTPDHGPAGGVLQLEHPVPDLFPKAVGIDHPHSIAIDLDAFSVTARLAAAILLAVIIAIA